MDSISVILFAALLGWFWLDSARAREIATGVCRSACERRQVQFLDQTVALRRLGLAWPRQGIRLRRVFRFDFSEGGMGRRTGYLVMVGQDLQEISLGLPEDPGDS